MLKMKNDTWYDLVREKIKKTYQLLTNEDIVFSVYNLIVCIVLYYYEEYDYYIIIKDCSY